MAVIYRQLTEFINIHVFFVALGITLPPSNLDLFLGKISKFKFEQMEI